MPVSKKRDCAEKRKNHLLKLEVNTKNKSGNAIQDNIRVDIAPAGG